MFKYFRNCSLFQQLIVPLAVVGVIGIGVTTFSAFILEGSVAALGDLFDAGNRRLKILQELDRSVAYYRALSLKHLASESAASMANIDGILFRTKKNIQDNLLLVAENDGTRSTANGRSPILARSASLYFGKIAEALRLSTDFEKEAAFELLTHADGEYLPQFQQSLQQLIRQEFEDTSSSRESLMSVASRNLQITIALGISGGTLLLVIAFIVTRRVAQRLSQLLDWAQHIASGDLSPRLHAGANDEVGRLAAAMGTMVENLSRAHSELADAKKAAEGTAEELRIYANAFASSGEAMLISDGDNRILNVNAAFTKQTGYALDDVKGENPRILASGQTDPGTYAEMWVRLLKDGFWQGELWDRKKSGETYPKWAAISAIRDASGKAGFYIASFTDISERKSAEARISHLAHHDILTGLFNRFSLEERLDQAIVTARREQYQVAVFFIDLDRFKNINDSLGHHMGDELLVQVAGRLRACVRESDIVARIGGDEFVVVLTGMKDGAQAASVAENMLREVSRPYSVSGHEMETSPSIGISVFPANGGNAEELLKNADIAMYHAKERGRKNYYFFTESMRIRAQARLNLERELNVALATGQFELHYQPQVRALDESIAGMEALIRWHHPTEGLVAPDRFIPVAEEIGLIHEIGAWVLDQACRQLGIWKTGGCTHLKMSINLSARQLQSDALADSVQSAMTRHGIGRGELELEITETAAMVNPDAAVEKLNMLRQLGVGLAIDDFGTGYSSLAYLRRLPIQVLKLDRTFVRDIESDKSDAEISAATLALAHNLGLQVVAEGVETMAQKDFLVAHGCDYLQGYLFSEPLSAAEATRFIQSRQAA